MRRVQIVERPAGAARWRMVAHGAAYDRAEADDMAARIKARGGMVRFLPMGKED